MDKEFHRDAVCEARTQATIADPTCDLMHPHLDRTVAAEVDQVQRSSSRYFCTTQLFQLGEWNWNIAKPAVSAISQNPLQEANPE